MSWVRTDDALHEHPKIVGLGDHAFRVWHRVLCHANRFPKLRGFVSDEVLRRLGATDRVRVELLRMPAGYTFGLWEPADGGILVHDFAEYAKRREEVSEKRAAAGRKSGENRRRRAARHEAQPRSEELRPEESATDPRAIGGASATNPRAIGERSARPPSRVDAIDKCLDSLDAGRTLVQQGPRARARDPVPTRPVEEEIPGLRPGASPAAAPLKLVHSPAKRASKRKATHTPEEIAAKGVIVDAFIECFEAKKGVKPKRLDESEHAAAFKLARVYDAAEGASIVRSAFERTFVVNDNATLKYIASKAETFRGERSARTGVRRPALQQLTGDEPWAKEALER